jgi:Ca-activated chloride channel homolog
VNFAHPKVIWISVIVLPLLGLFLWATWRKRQALVRQFVQHKALAQQTLGISVPRQKLRRILLLVAVAFILLTIAGPQWGFTWEEATQRGRDILVAIDTSRSMLAEDTQPNRLARAKLAALDLLQLGKFDRFGLIAFSGTAFLQCPLTFDDEAFRQNVQLLQPGIIPQGGTALSQAIQAARDTFSSDTDENHRILILFTDGEDHEAGVMELVQRAANDNIKIFTVGAGTPGGELLRTRDERGAMVYVKDEAGNVVKSRLNEELLKDIAAKTGGLYVPLQGGNAMEFLYQKGLAPLPTSDRTTKLTKRFKEQFYWPLIAAIVLLIAEIFLPEQRRAARPKGTAGAPSAPAPAIAAAILLLLFLPRATASPAKAQRHYEAGEYKSALSEYQELIGRNPADARLHYNAGAAAYKANKFHQAVQEFQAATGSPDVDLQQQSLYNLGNAEFRLGQGGSNPQERIALWEQAVQHYDAALKLNSADRDAEFNRDFVQKKLEELKQQQQQEQKKNDNKDNKEKDRQDQDDSSKDQQKQDNKDQNKENQSQQQNQEQQKDNQQNQQQKEEEKKQQQQQQQQNQQEKKDEQQNQQSQAQQGGQKESQDQKPDEDAGQYAQLGKMTPSQAKQLLDAQRDQEKALLFIPQERKSDARSRSFKDW